MPGYGRGFEQITEEKLASYGLINNNTIIVQPGKSVQDAIDAAVAGGAGITSGRLVFTGQPQNDESITIQVLRRDGAYSYYLITWGLDIDIGETVAQSCANLANYMLAAPDLTVSAVDESVVINAKSVYDGWCIISFLTDMSAATWTPDHDAQYWTIAISPGTYVGDITLPPHVRLRDLGRVEIDGNVVLGYLCTSDNVTENIYVTGGNTITCSDTTISVPTENTAMRLMDVWATDRGVNVFAPAGSGQLFGASTYAQIVSLSKRGLTGIDGAPLAPHMSNVEGSCKASIFDAPLPPPRYTDANAVFAIVLDDCNTNLVTVRSSGPLSGYSPLGYAQAKRVPVTLGVISGALGKSGTMTAAQIVDFIKSTGGEAACHSRTHGSSSYGTVYTNPNDRAYNEIAVAQREIESATGYQARTFLHTGGTGAFDPYSDPAEGLTAVILRQRMYIQRSTYNLRSIPYPIPVTNRYPCYMCTGNWQGIADPLGTKGLRRLIGNLAKSKGLAYALYAHTFVDGTPSSLQLSDTQWKQLIDDLSAYQDAGLIDVVPLSMFPYIHPAYRPSLIPNGGFEYTDGEGTGFDFYFLTSVNKWFAPRVYLSGSNTAAITSSEKHSGNNSLQMYHSGSGSCYVLYEVPVVPGDMYRLHGWVKTTVSGKTLTIDISFDGQNTITRTHVTSSTNWEYFRFNVSVPLNRYVAQLYVRVTNGTFYLDDLAMD
jgi:hypothetical protein